MCSCLQHPQLSELLNFLLWELSVTFYIFRRQSLPSWSCWFNLQLVQLVGRFWVLVTLPLGFNCGFISTSACGSFTGVCSSGCPGGLGFAPVRARCGGGAAAWVAGVLAAPGTQGSWWLGQQEIQCSRRVWQAVSASALQYSCLENPLRWQKPTMSQRVRHYRSNPTCIDARISFFLWQLCPRESWAWRWRSCLACRDPGGTKFAATRTASTTGVMALSESFFEPLVAGDQKASLANLSTRSGT